MKPLLALLLCGSASAFAQDKITYEDDLLPLFEQSCLNCHNPDKKKGDLDLSSYPALLAGGSGGKVALAGDGAASSLYTVTTGSTEPVMPPEGNRLNKEQQNLIRAWIDGGLLETKDSSARRKEKPKFDLTIDPSAGRPEGPPPLPKNLAPDPSFVAPGKGLIRDLVTSPWAPLVAFTGQKQVFLYHSETFRLLGALPFPKGQPESLTFHPSGQYLMASGGVAGQSGISTVWNIVTGEELFTAGREFDSVLASALSPDLSTVALGGPSRLLKIWNTRENLQSASIKKHTEWITALAASPDGHFVASGDRNGAIHVWDWDGNEIHALREHQGAITALEFRSDSKLLASTAEDGQLIVWDLAKGEPARKVNAHRGGVTALHYHRDGHLVTAGRDQAVKIFHPNFSEKVKFNNLPDLVTAVALSADGSQLLTGDFTGEVRVYRASKSKKLLATLDSNPPRLADRVPLLEKELATAQQKHSEALQLLQEARQQVTQLQKRIQGTRGALKKNEQNKKDHAQQIAALTRSLQKNEQGIAQLKEPRLETLALLKKQREKQSHLQQQRNSAKGSEETLAALEAEVARHQATLRKTEATAAEHKQQWKALQDERRKLLNQKRLLNQHKGEAQDLINHGSQSLQELEGQLSLAQKQLKEPLQAAEAAEKAIAQAQSELSFWKQP